MCNVKENGTVINQEIFTADVNHLLNLAALALPLLTYAAAASASGLGRIRGSGPLILTRRNFRHSALTCKSRRTSLFRPLLRGTERKVLTLTLGRKETQGRPAFQSWKVIGSSYTGSFLLGKKSSITPKTIKDL